ncbi:sugar-1-phosphate guanyl transferase [Niabella ginsenosidivorans]|uniref:Sugar-1-phosphate guanyl transferase n=1 Tax=Niabella ginsenosidivorans TaxID=1176587 RepID=A0A1A9I219_9BACT|nr:putative sugar nucleotidyl transferase [Niabella ginsenosidivorans]ANH80751.1 sugar-1-phosphate guanyl transferase [Niabella ginsenosidivorans]
MSPVTFTHNHYKEEQLFPFCLTTRVEDIPSGMLSNRKRWELIVEQELPSGSGGEWVVPANLLPSEELIALLKNFKEGDFLELDREGGAAIIGLGKSHKAFSGKPVEVLTGNALRWLEFGWNIFEHNAYLLHFDFRLLTQGRNSVPVPDGNRFTGNAVFIEEGASVRFAVINAEEGPVYIAKNALIMEGTCIRGPVFIGENAVVKMGTRIYGGTTVGYCCTVGGEIKNTVFFPFSNKAHDGYIGDAVIGRWCNLGGGTSNSNLKNTAGNISVILPSGVYKAGMKCGVLMGDYTRTAINTSINSGTVIGVCANVFGKGLTPKWIPSFSWGYNDAVLYEAEKILEHLERWMQTKKQTMTTREKEQITHIYYQTKTKKS